MARPAPSTTTTTLVLTTTSTTTPQQAALRWFTTPLLDSMEDVSNTLDTIRQAATALGLARGPDDIVLKAEILDGRVAALAAPAAALRTLIKSRPSPPELIAYHLQQLTAALDAFGPLVDDMNACQDLSPECSAKASAAVSGASAIDVSLRRVARDAGG